MEYFLSCDWGTTAFRLRLIEKNSLQIAGSVENEDGCASVYRNWLHSGTGNEGRQGFYLAFLLRQLRRLEYKTGIQLTGLPLMISGMASSTAGMLELPYKELPFLPDGSDLIIHRIAPSEMLNNPVLVVSGVRTENDVMRGEETKLMGLLSEGGRENTTLLLPGTHPKHIYIRKGKVSGFQTYMTGEFFALLSKQSLLAMSVSDSGVFNEKSFTAGVHQGTQGNLLQNSFLVRINTLFERFTSAQNYHYLSGLLIGSELKDLIGSDFPVTLMRNETSGILYEKGLKILNIPTEGTVDADQALIRGQAHLLRIHGGN